jgi:hypothetical protein
LTSKRTNAPEAHPFRVIFPLANGSPALQADFFVRQAFKKEQTN